MATLTIRKLDEAVRERLRMRAAQRGASMEEEVRRLLTEATREDANVEVTAFGRMRRHFDGLGVDLDLPGCEPLDLG